MFNFTVNPRDLALEPGIESPPAEIFDQLRFLAREFGPRTIIHRLDPITVYRGRDGAIRNNVAEADVEQIFAVLEECGVRESTVAFCYAVNRAVSARFRRAGLELIDPDEETKLRMLGEIKTIADRHQIVLRACCMGVREGLTQSGCCIDGKRIEEVYGIKLRRRAKDSGQRDTCKCTTSIDIGSYDLQCPHRCVYCYARPQEIEDAG
jgi:DNA repair photolyase